MSNRTAIKALVSSVAVAGALFVLASSTPAFAAGITGAASQVEYNASGTPLLMLQLNGSTSTNYLAQQPSPCAGIPALSADTVKIFHSLAQSALLAGKNITIYYNFCSGGTTPYIYDIVLIK